MAELTQVITNTLEQVLSADLNRMGALSGKHVQDRMLAILGSIDATQTPRDTVERGLLLTVGAGLSVSLSAGSFFRFNAGATGDQSQLRYATLAAAQAIALSAADPVNPRIDRISIQEGQTDQDSQIRNVLVLPARTVTPVAVNKTRVPTITVNYTAGTPGANPVAPATPPGSTAIWDIFVPASAVALSPFHLMDLRIRWNPFSLNRAHLIERGLGVTGSGGTVTLQTGRAFVDGAVLDLTGSMAQTGASIQEAGSPAIGPNQEWHLYLLAVGMREAIGAAVLNGLVLVLSQTAPAPDGTPTFLLTYNPLQGSGITAHSRQTQKALYAGSVQTDNGGNFVAGGQVIDRGGTVSALIDPGTGQIPFNSGWIKPPRLAYFDANTVRVGSASFFLGGRPGFHTGVNAFFAGNLAAGEVRATSTWYYIYLRGRRAISASRVGPRAFLPIFSSEAPNEIGQKPTPEAGFTSADYIYAGSFFNDGTNSVRPFAKEGLDVRFLIVSTNLWNSAPSVSPAQDTITALLPATSRTALITVQGRLTAGGGGGASCTHSLSSRANSAANTHLSIQTNAAVAGQTDQSGMQVGIPTTAAGAFMQQMILNGAGASFLATIIQVGYQEDVTNPATATTGE